MVCSTEQPNSLEAVITRTLLESAKKLASKLNESIAAVAWRLVGKWDEGETHYLFSRSCRGRDMFQLLKSRLLKSIPQLLGKLLLEQDEHSQSNSPCVNQGSFARPQRSFSLMLQCQTTSVPTSPPPWDWGSTREKTVIKKGCFVMPVMYWNCHC